MQQRLCGGARIEVAALQPEKYIRDGEYGRCCRAGQVLKRSRCENQRSDKEGQQYRSEQRRKNAPRPARVEVPKAETPGINVALDHAGD